MHKVPVPFGAQDLIIGKVVLFQVLVELFQAAGIVLDGEPVLVSVRAALLHAQLETVINFHERGQVGQLVFDCCALEADERRSLHAHQDEAVVIEQVLELVADR